MRVLKCKTDHRKLSLEISNVYIDNAQDNSLFQTIQTLITYPFFLVKKVHKMKLFSKTLVENFVLVSRTIRNCIGFALLSSVISAENLHHSPNQSGAKLKRITSWSPTSSRALENLLITLTSHRVSSLFLDSYCDYQGFGLCHSIEKRSIHRLND